MRLWKLFIVDMRLLNRKTSITYPYRRGLVLLALMLSLLVLVIRGYDLQVLRRDFLSLQGDARRQRVVEIPAHRGMITDRNGEPLAISTPVDSVWVNPSQFLENPDSLHILAKKLRLNPKTLQEKLSKADSREFAYVKRQLPPAEAQEVVDMGLPGVFLQREYRRYYPAGEVAAHVLGFTNIDDQGQEGLELAFNDWLRGEPGRKRVVRDRLGYIVEDIESIKPASPGRDLRLSIDKRLQYLAYRELKVAVQKHQADSGSLVMLDSFTGEVLAMVNQPAFNPHNRDDFRGELYRNRAITDVFEPGSTMKPFTIAAALEHGHARVGTKIDTAPGFIKISGHKIRDARNYGLLDIKGILQHSSNVGAIKLALDMPAGDLWHTYIRFGFGQGTGSGFPGESPGVLQDFDSWAKIEQATLAFGYGLSTTATQLVHAYSILANGGYDLPVSFIFKKSPAEGTRVLSEQTAEQIRAMLATVVEEGGTGVQANVPGYKIGGKTGTARQATAQGYSEEDYFSLFAGFAPLSDPRLVLVVVINRPQGQYSGGQVAAPVFAAVMEDALRLLNVPPDDLQTLYARSPNSRESPYDG